MSRTSHNYGAYQEIERYLERAQEEIGIAFYDLQLSQNHLVDCQEEFFPRPPSGDVQLLVSWAEEFARAVQIHLPEEEELNLTESLSPIYQKCKYGTVCPLIKNQWEKIVQEKRHLLCPWYKRQNFRDSSDYLTREIGIQTQWSDVDGEIKKESSIINDTALQRMICTHQASTNIKLSFESFDFGNPLTLETDEDCVMTRERSRSVEDVSKVDCQNSKEQYSSSLPKELTRKPPIRNSPSDSSTISSQVSRTELRDFMKKVECSTYRPPTPENKEVETDVNTCVNHKDAITQTTPQLSRSSSFTWVTECDCSDLDTISEHSLLSFSCSTTTSSDLGGQETSTSSESSLLISNQLSPSSSSLSLSSVTSLKSDFSADIINCDQVDIWEKQNKKTIVTTNTGDTTPDSGFETVTDLIVKSPSLPTLQRHLSLSGENTSFILENEQIFLSKFPKGFIELQALEACMWLKAAGFPQYAQMYEENQFPIDLRIVQTDHNFLDEDSLQALYRRLDTLNRCTKLKAIDSVTRHSLPDDDTDEEELCALSDSWQFERSNRRWSRIPSSVYTLDNVTAECITKKYTPSYSSDSVLGDEHQSSPDSTRKVTLDRRRFSLATEETLSVSGSSSGGSPNLIAELKDKHHLKKSLRRSGSDRIKEGAKALLRRMDSLKGKKKKKNNREENETREVIMVTTANDTEASPNCSSSSSPKISHHQSSPTSTTTEDSSAGGDTSEGSQESTPKMKQRRTWRILGRSNSKSNSCNDVDQSVIVFDQWRDSNFNNPKLSSNCIQSKDHKYLNGNIYANNNEHFDDRNIDIIQCTQKHKKISDSILTPVVIFNRTCSLETENKKTPCSYTMYSQEDSLSRLTNSDPEISESIDISINRGRRDSGVGSSLNRPITLTNSIQQSKWHCFPCDLYWSSGIESSLINERISIDNLLTPQLMVLRKFSLLKLTTLMEKYTPSSRTGWNWAVPKFIRKIRTPDYKDKILFGVPLILMVQRTGYPLPASIQAAMRYLEKTSLDTVGIFRKSGVRSRIQKLRNQNESSPEKIDYEEQQAYDIADMIKQYFRELPEALLTNKLSETFISIFQYIPEEQRLDALQAAILLMPDENREVLDTLLAFLNKVYQHAGENQMTATNLAVCFAPSLFHLTTPRSASASPRRRKTVVVLDQKELNENRAAYECLTKMILEYEQLFTVSGDTLSHNHVSFLEHCYPATLEELGKLANKSDSGWKIYIDWCISALMKEIRDKFKGWIPINQNDGTDIAYKKVGDGYPLRLWKVVVEVEAPPTEVLNRVLRERQAWDETLIKWRTITRLEKHAEIFQYACMSLLPHLPRDYCILRSWQTDLPKGTCILIEMSVNHSSEPLLANSIRGMVLVSRYLVEPCGSGKSRVTHISRVDMCGRSSEWYNKVYGSISAMQLSHLRDSFSLGSEGPETKV